MRVSFAVFMFCEVKLNVPSDNAAARALDADEVCNELGAGRPPLAGADRLVFGFVLDLAGCLWSCSAFASAFSCVLTNWARL